MLAHVRSLPPSVGDWLVAGALTAYAGIDVWLRHDVVPGPKLLGALGLAAMTIPLAWRRRWPMAVACVSMLALALESMTAGGAPEGGVVLLPVLVVLYTVAAYERLPGALLGAAAALVAGVVQTVQDPKLAGVGEIVLVDGFFFVMIGGAVWLAGRYVRRRRRQATVLEGRAHRLERERQHQDMVIAAERGRIARELHDVIAHTVSVMGVQAAAAARVLDDEPERARAPLQSIEVTARDAVAELSRLLGVLRESSEPIGLAPQPDLGNLDDLLRPARQSGLTVDLAIHGEARALPPGIELAAYRIVQEALTNARKHAGGARVRVTLTYRPTHLQTLIEDDGHDVANGSGTGHGLIGMRERAALYGGTLEAGPRPQGGFSVRACLPLGDAVR